MTQPHKTKKPIRRGKVRKYLGRRYFILKRHFHWFKNKPNFATTKSSPALPYHIFSHSSTLLRKLKDVEMQYQVNKIENLKLAIAEIDNIVIKPGQTFSLWYLVGRPSKSRGYLKGLVLNNGKIGYDYGGGLCQLGNLLYWMVLHSPLTVTERWRHGYDVFPDVQRKLPFGSGATLAYNYIDLQVANTTTEDFQLKLWLTETKLHGELLASKEQEHSYEVYEDYHLMQQESWGGYTRHNRLNRKVINSSNCKIIDDATVTENHAIMMYEPFLEEKVKG